MADLIWEDTGKRKYYPGVDHGVLYVSTMRDLRSRSEALYESNPELWYGEWNSDFAGDDFDPELWRKANPNERRD